MGFSNDRPEYLPGTNPIACPGKFQGSTLVILTNGTGASAGYFFPELVRDKSVFVSAGGFVGEPLVSGIARGGAVWGMNNFEAWAEQYFIKYYYGPAVAPIPYLRRSAESYIEQPGMYAIAVRSTAQRCSPKQIRWAMCASTSGPTVRRPTATSTER